MLLVCLALNQALILHGRAEGGAAFVNASSNSNKALGKKSFVFFFFPFPSLLFFLGKRKCWNQSNLTEWDFSCIVIIYKE